MTTATLTVRPFPTMGAEVTDVDLARLDDETFRALLEAWWTYGILVFPGARTSTRTTRSPSPSASDDWSG